MLTVTMWQQFRATLNTCVCHSGVGWARLFSLQFAPSSILECERKLLVSSKLRRASESFYNEIALNKFKRIVKTNPSNGKKAEKMPFIPVTFVSNEPATLVVPQKKHTNYIHTDTHISRMCFALRACELHCAQHTRIKALCIINGLG